MDERSAWTPGEPPEDAGQMWSAPSAPGGAPSYPGSPDYPGYPTSSYPPPGASPYAPPPATPPTGDPRFGTPAPQPFQPGPYGTPTEAPYGQTPYGQPPFGAGPVGYPPAGQAYYGGPPPMAPYGGAPLPPYVPSPRTDGFAIAALVFGILGGWLSFVFGGIALNRIKRTGARGRGMAIAGMVTGGTIIVIEFVLAGVVPSLLAPNLHSLHTSCANGNMAACDSLYDKTTAGDSEHTFADTCGGRTDGGYLCTSVGAVSYGDNKHLDSLWDACKAGDLASCDELYYSSAPGSDYSHYGMTCGDRTDGSTDCVDPSGDQTSST